MVFIGDGVFALSKGVPQFDGLISGTGNYLSVISGEGNGVDILSVSLKVSDGVTGVQVPESHSGVHGSGQSELTIRGDNGITDGLIVSGQQSSSVTFGVIIPQEPKLLDLETFWEFTSFPIL